MPAIGKLGKIVIRLFCSRLLGMRIHAIYGDTELVLSVWPLKVIQGEAPAWVREQVLAWAAAHERELLAVWKRCQSGLVPVPMQP